MSEEKSMVIPLITDAGKTFFAKIVNDSDLISLGLNENGTIRRYEKGELIAEFKNIDEYTKWLKLNRPDELCEGLMLKSG